MKYYLRICLLFTLIFSTQIRADNSAEANNLKEYLNLLDKYPQVLGPDGNWQSGEIEILRNIDEIAQVKVQTGRVVGVVAKDKYWIWLNDAVRFPNGTYGVYSRLLWNHAFDAISGAAVLCVLPDQRLVLNCNYRHATRAWELELPRGGALPGETSAATARREVLEETGMVIEDVVLLGEVAVDSGLTNSICPIYYSRVVRQEISQPEDSEAIEGIIAFSLTEILEGLAQGYMQVTINGKTRQMKLRDSFLTYAIVQAQFKGLLPKN